MCNRTDNPIKNLLSNHKDNVKIKETLEFTELCVRIVTNLDKLKDHLTPDISNKRTALRLLRSYLRERKYFVTYNGYSSGSFDSTPGVPQG